MRYLFVKGDGRRQGKSERMRLIADALREAGHDVVEAKMSDPGPTSPPMIVDDPLLRIYLDGCERRSGKVR